ncbi:MAG: N-acetylmannosaminyltransferase [uncultured Rubrobacteraceae bacterium]|uniref:N-acetylmannosaminyltransferase n=1 Tax=uncultured Rubrobacteraceae bacterium TaxID=349277 RepID=A0A6J4QF79_9ACTN|nr:MAG: N-acetylmannosaminyltransferase [uncultured Rubrobacteraceae bacterium]
MSRPGRVEVLGVGVDPATVDGLHAEIRRLVRRRGGVVLNANAHCLNLCYRDPALRRFFGAADLVFCDGAGVKLAARMLGGRLPERITYADWLPRLADFAEEEGLSLFFLGARPGVAERAAKRLRATRPALKVVGVRHGYFDRDADGAENGVVVAEINAARPDVLLLGLGMPLQERWLMENRRRLDVGVALTGGAVFDYASGGLRRGPRLLTDNGLEWLARLLVEPRRLWRRYLLGNPLFLLRVLRQRLGGPR